MCTAGHFQRQQENNADNARFASQTVGPVRPVKAFYAQMNICHLQQSFTSSPATMHSCTHPHRLSFTPFGVSVRDIPIIPDCTNALSQSEMYNCRYLRSERCRQKRDHHGDHVSALIF